MFMKRIERKIEREESEQQFIRSSLFIKRAAMDLLRNKTEHNFKIRDLVKDKNRVLIINCKLNIQSDAKKLNF